MDGNMLEQAGTLEWQLELKWNVQQLIVVYAEGQQTFL